MAFERTETVRFQHCDPAGIVFYPRYVEMVNATVEDWFAQEVQCSFADLHGPMRAAIPAVSLELAFKSPSRLGETLTFRLLVARVGTSSLDLSIGCASGAEHRFEAKLTVVHISQDDFRPRPWPASFRDVFQRQTPALGNAAGQSGIGQKPT
jgi:4-hydroxybenzoyl-CoA thioesterase